MNFEELYGKKVKIIDVDNKVFTGYVTDYVEADDNNYPEDNPEESIIVDVEETGHPTEFIRRDIAKLNVIEEYQEMICIK